MKMFEFLNSNNASKNKLDESMRVNLRNNKINEDLTSQAYKDAENEEEISVLASSIDHDNSQTNINTQNSIALDLSQINKQPATTRKNHVQKISQRSQKPYTHLLEKGKIKRGLLDSLISQNGYRITEETQENLESKKQFFETFNPAKEQMSHNSLKEEIHDIQNGQQQVQTEIQSDSFAIKDRLRSNQSFQKVTLSKLKDLESSKKFKKLISSDYVPGPGQYNIQGSFKSSQKSLISHKKQFSQQIEMSSVLNNSTSRGLSQPYDQSIDKSIYSTRANQSVIQQAVPSGDAKFGLSFENVKKQYFKEYEVELYGMHSPGPGAYSPVRIDFKDEKYDQKSMPKDKRVCPIVPRQHQILQLSPFTYNNQFTSFNVHKNANSYFGSKAERKVDARLFGQQHSYVVKKGLY